MKRLIFAMLLFTAGIYAEKLKVGITLHPYYSFVKNIGGDKVEVIPIIDGNKFDSHNYQLRPDDIRRVEEVDLLVINGIGHDEFIFDILRGANTKEDLEIVYANDGIGLMYINGTLSGDKVINPHSFISISSSIQQIYNINKKLAELDPENKSFYRKNTRAYVKKLRNIKAEALEKLSSLDKLDLNIATLHGGYDYLFAEFGLNVKAVIEPKHGLKPSATELQETIEKIKDLDIDIIFTELNLENKYVDTIEDETGKQLAYISHMTYGDYSAESFEVFIKKNIDIIVEAIIKVNGG